MAAFDPAGFIKKKNARLQDIPDIFNASVEAYQQTLFNDLSRLMELLKRDDEGNIIFDSDNILNLSLIDQITKKLKDEILNSDYVNAVDDFAQEFDAQAALNDEYFSNVFSFEGSDAADATVDSAKEGTVDMLLGSSLDTEFLSPLKTVLTNAVTARASWTETVDFIRTFVEGDDEVDGRLLSYTKQIAHDTFAIADRSYTNTIADEVDAEWYLWSGQDLPSSRCFCEARKGKYFHWKEIEAWGNGDNVGDCDLGGGDWAGKRDGTNGQTIFQYGGGYGCVDSEMPVSVSMVPKEVLQRNVDNGNFEPSDKQAELLGI